MKKIISPTVFVAALIALAGCSKPIDEQVVGKWKYSYNLDMPADEDLKSAKIALNCDSEYFPTKSVNHTCTFDFTGETPEPSNTIKMTGNVVVTGEWSAVKEVIYDKTIGSSVEIKSLAVNDQPVDDKQMMADAKSAMSEAFVKGQTSVMKTLSINQTTWVFEDETDEKKKTVVTAMRQ